MTGCPNSGKRDQTVILIAGDEALIRIVARIALEKKGYFILTCQDGEEALHISRSFPGIIHAVLSDVKMPKVNGLELRENPRRESWHQDLTYVWTDGFQAALNVEFLPKSFGPSVLQNGMRTLLASPESV